MGIHYKTLYNWDKNNDIQTIRTPRGKRLYNINKFIEDSGINIDPKLRRNICYCRVSTYGQRDDFKRQIDYMKNKFSKYEIIKDVASGLNFKRRGLNKIIKYTIDGEIS